MKLTFYYASIGCVLLAFIIISFFLIGKDPAALYWDELAIGIDAYSIVTTGRDVHGHSWLQAIYPSYGDYKAPVAIWLVSLSVSVFGLSIWSVRLPFLCVGIWGALGCFFLGRQFVSTRSTLFPQLIGVLFLLTSPWFFHFSHIGFESFLSLNFLIWTLVITLWGLERWSLWLCLLPILSSLNIYSYVSARYITPIFIGSILITNPRTVWTKKWGVASAVVLSILLLIPLYLSPFYFASQQLRWSADNILTSGEVVPQSAELIYQSENTLLARLLYHRYWFLAQAFLRQFLQHFSWDFLWLTGDNNLRHHSGWGGQLLAISLPVVLVGVYRWLTFAKDRRFWMIGIWLLVAPVTASIPTEVPHASRSIYLLIPLTLITILGAEHLGILLSSFKSKIGMQVAASVIVIAFLVNFGLYLEDYWMHYSIRSAQAWQLGNRYIGEWVRDHPEPQTPLTITNGYRLPVLSILFYNPLYIAAIQQQSMGVQKKANYAWLEGFDRFAIAEASLRTLQPGTTYLAYPSTELSSAAKQFFLYPDGSPALVEIEVPSKN